MNKKFDQPITNTSFKQVFYFVILAFMEPALFSKFSSIDNVYMIWKLIAIAVSLYVFVTYKHKFEAFDGLVILFWLTFVLSTVINNGSLIKAIQTVTVNMFFCLYFNYSLKYNAKKTLEYFFVICTSYTILNYVLFLLFPNGFDQYISGYQINADSRVNLLGKDNTLLYFYIPTILVAVLNYYNKNKKKLYAVMAIVILSMISVWSGTGIVGGFFLILYTFLVFNKPSERLYNVSHMPAVYIVVYFSIVIFRMQEIFSGIIVGILHKDITFTGRVTLWDMAIEYIKARPFFGYGITQKFLVTASGIAYSPHNLFLEMILSGGAFSFIIFLIIFIKSQKKLKKAKNQSFNKLISFFIFVYLIGSLTESTLNTQYLYCLLILAYRFPDYEQDII